MRSFFRYPGGKYKLLGHILSNLEPRMAPGREYREPFYGGGSVGLNVMQKFKPETVWINDGDPALADLWTAVIRDPEELKACVREFEPSVQAFYDIKEFLSGEVGDSNDYSVERGFLRLAIQQISYSGLGVKSGGPLGGKDQKSKYGIDCRWSPDYICKRINQLHKMFSTIEFSDNRCTPFDFGMLIQEEGDAVLYLDPPYYEKGSDLYQFGFNLSMHKRLRDDLKACQHQWVLSYDDHPAVVDMYIDWADIKRIENVNYSITAVRDRDTGETSSRTKSELLITNRI